MIESAARESKAGDDVLGLEVGKLFQNGLLREPRREEIEDIDDANAHPPNTRASAAFLGVNGDSVREVRHGLLLKSRRC